MSKVNYTKEVNGVIRVNMIGCFQSDFFSYESLMERQKQIRIYLNRLEGYKEDKKEAIEEAKDLYNATEQMRVVLLQAEAEKRLKTFKAQQSK